MTTALAVADQAEDGMDNDAGYFSEEAATFGDRLAAARRQLGLSQEDMARKLGVKLKTQRAWEDDFAEPRANKLQMMAGVLNVSIMWLLTGNGDGLDGPAQSDAPTDRNLRELMVEFRSLSAEQIRLGERFARLEKRLRRAMIDQPDTKGDA